MKILRNKTTGCLGCGSFGMTFAGTLRHERPGMRGISHLAEHCMSLGAKRMESRLNALGIRWNANTGETGVSFHLSGLIDSVDAMRDEFADGIIRCGFSREEFETERRAVLSEYDEDFSNRRKAFWYNFDRAYCGFAGSLGMRDEIASVTYEDLTSFREEFMARPSFFGYVSDSGHPPLDGKWLESHRRRYGDVGFSDESESFPVRRAAALPLASMPIEGRFGLSSPNGIIFSNAEVECADEPSAAACASVLSRLLGDGLSSLLHRKLRDGFGDCYSVDVFHCPTGDGGIRIQAMAFVSAERSRKMAECLHDTLAGLRESISEDEFDVRLMQSVNEMELESRSCYSYDDRFDGYRDSIGECLGGVDFGKFMEFVRRLSCSEIRLFTDENGISELK